MIDVHSVLGLHSSRAKSVDSLMKQSLSLYFLQYSYSRKQRDVDSRLMFNQNNDSRIVVGG